MTQAVCVGCGGRKFGALVPCPDCLFAPNTEYEIAYSIALTDHYFDLDTLGEIGQHVKETGRLPRLPPEQEKRFIQAAKNYKDEFAGLTELIAEGAAAEGLLSDLSEEIRTHLVLLPYRIFRLIAAADGVVDKKEVQAFQRTMNDPGVRLSFKSSLFTHLLLNAARSTNYIQWAAGCTGTTSFRNIAEEIQPHVNRDEYDLFVKDIICLALIVANASGGGLFGRGNRIDKSEARAIEYLESEFFDFVSRRNKDRVSTFVENLHALNGFWQYYNMRPENELAVPAFVISILDYISQVREWPNEERLRGINVLSAAAHHMASVEEAKIWEEVKVCGEGYARLFVGALGASVKEGSEGFSFFARETASQLFQNAFGRTPKGEEGLIVMTALPMVIGEFFFDLLKDLGS